MSNIELSKVWPEWKVEDKPLGRGSYGVVYKAVRLDHDVESYAAIKVISIPQNESEVDSLRSEGLSMDATRTYLQGIVNDFVSEIQLMESFKGVQNIVSVEDYKVIEKKDEIGWDIYIRMELLTPFNSYISDKTLSETEVIKLGIDICTALELCAKRDVIHRDIKPQNIFINQFGHYKLGDFGIARKLENVTGGLSQKGSPNYMAPEVAKSTQYDATVDLYSLGIVLYQLMNKNRLPFLDTEKQLLNPNERSAALNRRLEGEPLPAPCDASAAMSEVILCACNPNPNERFASATDMKNALISVSNGTYSANIQAVNKTVSVRRANEPQDLNRTTSVRKAQQAQSLSPEKIDTFGEKKKSKVPKIIAIILVAAILVGGGIFAVPKLFGNNENKDSSAVSGENGSEYSDYDLEQIAASIADAEKLAAKKDYEGALEIINASLVTYPKSEDLKAKETEYTTALTEQVKAKTLEDAESFAESGDYASAIKLIKKAQDEQGDNADYKTAYNSYCKSYKEDVIAAADKLAEKKDYIAAIEKISEATNLIGEDSELTSKLQSYEDSYISDIIAQADDLISSKKYDEADELVNSAKKHFPNNTLLLEESKKITNSRPVYLLDEVKPYKTELYYEDNGIISMGGKDYSHGFTCMGFGDKPYRNGTYFNLDGKYSELRFTTGIVDDSANDSVSIAIYTDGELAYHFDMKMGDLPSEHSVDISGCKQLIFSVYDERVAMYSGTYGFADIIVVPN